MSKRKVKGKSSNKARERNERLIDDLNKESDRSKLLFKVGGIVNIVAIAIVVGIMLGVVIAYVAQAIISKNKENDSNFDGVKATSAEVRELQDLAAKQIDYMLSANTFMNIVTSDSTYDNVLYNSNGEIISVDNYGESIKIYLNNGTCYSITSDAVTYGKNADILNLLSNIVNELDEFEVYKLDFDSTDYGDREIYYYDIHLTSWDEVYKSYSCWGDEFADSMVEALKTQMGDEDSVHITYEFLLTDKAEMSVSCLYELDGVTYLNWYADGYMVMYDWQLVDEWYTYDIESDSEGDELTALLDSQMTIVNNVINQFVEDNGLAEESTGLEGESVGLEGESDSSEIEEAGKEESEGNEIEK